MTEQTTHREVPAWVFVVVIILCLMGGGAFVYYWFSGGDSPLSTEIQLKEGVDLTPERGRGRGRPPPQRREGPIQLQRADGEQRVFLVQAGRNSMNVVDRKSGGPEFEVRLRRLLSGQASQLGRAAMRIAGDNQVARMVQATDEQREKLRELRFDNHLMQGTPVELTAEEKAKLTAAWTAADLWNKSPAPETERRIVRALEEVIAGSTDRTRESLVKHAEKVREILTGEQIRAFNQMGREENTARNQQAAPQPGSAAPPTTQRSGPRGSR